MEKVTVKESGKGTGETAAKTGFWAKIGKLYGNWTAKPVAQFPVLPDRGIMGDRPAADDADKKINNGKGPEDTEVPMPKDDETPPPQVPDEEREVSGNDETQGRGDSRQDQPSGKQDPVPQNAQASKNPGKSAPDNSSSGGDSGNDGNGDSRLKKRIKVNGFGDKGGGGGGGGGGARQWRRWRRPSCRGRQHYGMWTLPAFGASPLSTTGLSIPCRCPLECCPGPDPGGHASSKPGPVDGARIRAGAPKQPGTLSLHSPERLHPRGITNPRRSRPGRSRRRSPSPTPRPGWIRGKRRHPPPRPRSGLL